MRKDDHAGGGSRAAKKRRKQKGKAAVNSSTQSNGPLPAGASPKKRMSVSDANISATRNGIHSGETKSRKQSNPRRRTFDEQVTSGKRQRAASTDEASPVSNIKTVSETASRARSTPTDSAELQTKIDPVTIDASEADARTRPLMNLDIEGVLEDPAVESGLKARQVLQWMIAPLTLEQFYESFWEINAFVIKGRNEDYFKGWLRTADIESFISGQAMQYGTDLDITNYVNKKRITLNPSATSTAGRKNGSKKVDPGESGGNGAVVTPKYVWEKFREGCSLRMPCPQKFSDPLHRLLSSLEEEFGCMVGSNVYLTPARSQGFAPHWDDIEAFLLQIEGRKRWRVYRPRTEGESLPRFSSPNLTDDQVGEPALEVVLEPGDLLYFPRGWAHQAETVGDEASLHITVSAMQANCWADFIEGVVPQAIASAVQGNLSLRRGLPRDYLEFMGVVHSDQNEDARRKSFQNIVRRHLDVVVEEAMQLLDAAADQMGKRYTSDRLPPVLVQDEEASSVAGRQDTPLTPNTMLRMVRRGCARLLLEDEKAVVYHCMDNARVHHGAALSPLEFEVDDAPAIEMLLAAYPDPVKIDDLPHPPAEDLDDKLGIATSLWREGFLMLADRDLDEASSSSEEHDDDVATAGSTGRTVEGEEEQDGQDEEGL